MPAAADFDFVRSFPWPHDEAMNRAGRVGILDQKLDDDPLDDQQWLGLLHHSWGREMSGHMTCLDLLEQALAGQIDPSTGQRVKTQARWNALAQGLETERAHRASVLKALLSSYADHFGAPAADRFESFLRGERAERPVVLTQQVDLF